MRMKSILLGATLLLVGWLSAVYAADHPRLIDAANTECTVCHDDVLVKEQVHAPAADDCTSCHDVEVGDDATTVTLMEEEPSLCVFCHDDFEQAVEADLETPHFPVTESCLTCHDPHSAEEPTLLRASPVTLCADCHDMDDLGERHGGQLTEATRCGNCHNPHGSDHNTMLVAARQHSPFAEGSCNACHRPPFGDRIRLRVRGERLCEACHGDVAEDPEDPISVHAALDGEGGAAGCLSCHDPHMSEPRSLLKHPGNELCAGCHAATVHAANAETGHAPAADDCLTCHRPHAAGQPRLLSGDRNELCTDCHEPEDEDLVAAHLGATPSGGECTNCHSPHGEGHAKLLARTLHPPVLDGCDTCHEGGHDELMEGGGSELCLFCHDDIGEAATAATVPHEALELGACTDCHNPHATAQPHLVKAPGAGPCIDCHDDQAAGDGEVAHGVIDAIGCYACHQPHGGEGDKLLREQGSELCLSCHRLGAVPMEPEATTALFLERFEVSRQVVESAAILALSPDGSKNHPVGNHPTIADVPVPHPGGEDTVIEINCLTCHDPHKGRSAKLFRWGAATVGEACANCHEGKE